MLKKIQRQAELRKINKDFEALEKRSSEINAEADELGKKYEEEEITYGNTYAVLTDASEYPNTTI